MPDILDPPNRTELVVRPWIDPLVDESGHDPRSLYVERFWLGVLGPTATWVLRRLAAGLDHDPDGYTVDLGVLSREMGLGFEPGRVTPFSRALRRCVMFGVAHPIPDGLAVRRRVPAIGHRHLRRMPESTRRAHDEWERTTITLDELTRAHRLGLAMIEIGDGVDVVQHQLVALGVGEVTAAEVADNLVRLGQG